MKNIILTVGLALMGSFVMADSARAYNGAGTSLGFMPFGFYQPYGIRYSTSVRTPPHFAVNPPVYYGSRYARPYGASPFASPPLLTAPAGYQAQPIAAFARPIGPQICNPYCSELSPEQDDAVEQVPHGETVSSDPVRVQSSESLVGPVRSNPLVSVDEIALGVIAP